MALTATHPAHAVVSPGIARTTEQLVAVNAVTGWILSFGLVVAPAAAGAVLAASGPGAAYAAGAGCLVVAAVLVVPLRDLVPPLARGGADSGGGAVRQLEEGARLVARSSASREVVIVLAATFLMIGAFDVLAIVLAIGTLGIGGSGAGYLTATHGVGAVAGALASFALAGRARLVPVMIGAALLAAMAFLLLGIVTSILVAFVVAAVSGVSRSLLEVTGQTLLQRVTSTALLARVFAFKEGLTMAAWGLGSVTVPLVIAIAGRAWGAFVTGAIVPAIVLLRLRPLRRVDAAAAVPVVAIALLRSLQVFRALPLPALEGIAQVAHNLSVPAGAAIVRQGEPGDRYYAIADGTVEVITDPVATLGRGEGFGEIALLQSVTRTATVVAVTAAALTAIEREPFLVAVTGHRETHERLEHVASHRLRDDST